ncbi:uncharacterized protein LOC114164323 [Vigna unguiculata]|uniref:Uncharacterized protein n=1 Tax=Vigna unguiculata TaxID=3917 RepID=A0A4D6NRN2_VIGUN|nr:uncharacterized protein LOC114164323 [Vigna unguiculata]QCE16286.1 hypothetical protein DEO72_LG11g3299 [Vigna unguiculata]
MDVAVLHPQDFLANKPPNHYQAIAPNFSNMKLPNPNPKFQRSSRSRKKRADPVPRDARGPAQPARPQKHQPQKLVMGQVKILKRGELLSQTTPDLQPPTETVEKEVTTETKIMEKSLTSPSTEKVEGLYAGYSLMVTSPPPNSVPLPIFITKKFAATNCATSDLRKILRLDFP